MTENWKPYLCNVNGKIASIFVNLGLRESVPIGSKPWLLWTWVHFQSPRTDSLSDRFQTRCRGTAHAPGISVAFAFNTKWV